MSLKAPHYETQRSFLNFETTYDATFSTIVIIIAVTVLLYILRKLLVPRKSEYHSQEYWESRYSLFSKQMDWYCPFEKIANDFNICELLDAYYEKKNKTRILELGCGNSSMAFDMHNLGYRKITSIDFSSIIVKQMKEKHKGTSINCKLFIIQSNKLTFSG